MAIPTNIKTLLSGDVVEWARIEFKETWDAAASLKSICAFANDLDNWGGGCIVIGVQENNGRPVYPLKGVPMDKLDSYQKNIFAKCKLLRPAYTPIIGVETYQNKQFTIEDMISGSQKGAEKEPKRSQKKEPKKGAERNLDILQKLEENPEITQVKLMEEFDLSRKQIQKIIKDLREEGLVERQGSNRSGKWIVKK